MTPHESKVNDCSSLASLVPKGGAKTFSMSAKRWIKGTACVHIFCVYIMRHDDDGVFFSPGRRCWSLPPFIGLPMSCHRNQIRPINRSQIHAQPRQLQPLRRPRSWPGRLMKRESRRRWYELNPKSARQKKAIVTDQASGAKAVARPKGQCSAETKGMHNLI